MISAKYALTSDVACSVGTFVITSFRAALILWTSSGLWLGMMRVRSALEESPPSVLTCQTKAASGVTPI
jgi:hypothetical protein